MLLCYNLGVMSNFQYDVVVIGGGPAGMMAAGRAAECGARVLLVEKNKVLGKKLSITGGGRCNILNAESDTRTLLAHYGEAAKYLFSPFAKHGMQDSRNFFETHGLPLVVEARKRAFPESQKATDVTMVMKNYVTENNVELWLKTKFEGWQLKNGSIVGVVTSRGVVTAGAYVVAAGGASHQETGSTGEVLESLKELGHTVHAPSPDIVPLAVKDQWVKELSGTSLSFMKITFADTTGKQKISRTGKLLFTHFGLSGPLILNVAREVRYLLEGGPVSAYIDLYPDTDEGTVRQRTLKVFDAHKNKSLKNVLKDCVPAGMAEAVAAHIQPELLEEKVHSISKEERHQLVALLKAMPLTVTGTMGMDRAVISDGGVPLTEIDTRTMVSRKHANLFLIGDSLHINRPSGGFSLQLCWTTGWVAGTHSSSLK